MERPSRHLTVSVSSDPDLKRTKSTPTFTSAQSVIKSAGEGAQEGRNFPHALFKRPVTNKSNEMSFSRGRACLAQHTGEETPTGEVSGEDRASVIWEKIAPREFQADQELEGILEWWRANSTTPEAMRKKYGDVLTDRFYTYVQKKGAHPLFGDYKKLEMSEFREMLQEADWLKENKACKIVQGWLLYGPSVPEAHFMLRLQSPNPLFLQLCAYALQAPELESDVYETSNVEFILPHIYRAVRYKSIPPAESSCTHCFVTLGMFRISEWQNMS